MIDLACGKGRHSVYLHQLGYNVLGLDLSKESILQNKKFETDDAAEHFLKFAVHDMRNEIYPEVSAEKVDAVFNLFTSFGYFDDETEDKKIFRSVANALKDDGYFVLDFLNANWVKNTLVSKRK
ncbi:class I SAM-dependent methyltransferase [Kaistella anthropi]|nr:class I SAM-dependent methyltransferase [Kaistella anthropi]